VDERRWPRARTHSRADPVTGLIEHGIDRPADVHLEDLSKF